MRVAVIGAGSVGVASAWWLRQAGFDVTVIDRQSQVAQDSTRLGGGLISVGQARPWARPSAPWQLIAGLFQDHAPIMFRPRSEERRVGKGCECGGAAAAVCRR